MQSFSSKQLFFKPLCESDKDLIVALYTNEKTMRYVEPTLSEAEAIKVHNYLVRQNKKSSSKLMSWAAFKPNDKITAIGFITLYFYAGKIPLEVPEVGIMLRRQANGKLFAEEALAAAVYIGLNHLKLNELHARYHKKNLATKRITKKIGFKPLTSPSDNLLQTANTDTIFEYITFNEIPALKNFVFKDKDFLNSNM